MSDSNSPAALKHVVKRRSLTRIADEDGILTSSSIGAQLALECKKCRSSGDSIACLNDLNCNHKFLRIGGIAELLQFRKRFWNDDWRTVLDTELRECSSGFVEDEHCRHFSFRIGSINVCKDFYRAITGLSRKVFNNAYSSVRSDGRMHRSHSFRNNNKETLWFVLSFLDGFFSGYRVQHDPTSAKKAMLYSTWDELYHGTFKDFCRRAQHSRVSYQRFCSIRRNHRPGYTIAKTFRKKCGWNHMACDICDNFKRRIAAETCYKDAKQMQVAFDDHVNQMVRIRICTIVLASSSYICIYIYICVGFSSPCLYAPSCKSADAKRPFYENGGLSVLFGYHYCVGCIWWSSNSISPPFSEPQ